jgi:hypothetical protein
VRSVGRRHTEGPTGYADITYILLLYTTKGGALMDCLEGEIEEQEELAPETGVLPSMLSRYFVLHRSSVPRSGRTEEKTSRLIKTDGHLAMYHCRTSVATGHESIHIIIKIRLLP